MTIRILPTALSSQISAGEVIQRPASVVKEIIENSIDSGAKSITVEIEKSGLQSIIIKDDGYGIEKKELLLAITRHATSKIHSLSDLDCISTFGFRGEALASIRAISRLTLISSTNSNDIAWKIYSEGFVEKNLIFQPIAHPQGTTVIVENLFYNIPVRLKFIKNKKLEFLKINDIFKKIVLSHFHINFSLKHNEKLILQYNAVNCHKNKIYRLKEILNIVDINYVFHIKSKINNILLSGWIMYPESFKKSKNIQYCYVNNRYVQNKMISTAACSACYKILGIKNISFILYLTIPFNKIDVNIHPTKYEIKFHQSHLIYKFIYETFFNKLKKNKIACSLKYPLIKKDVNSSLKNKCTVEKYDNFISNIYLKKYNFTFGKLLIITRKYYGLIYHDDNFSLISFPLAKGLLSKYKLKNNIQKSIIPKYAITYIKINLTYEEYKIIFHTQKVLSQLGFSLILIKNCVILTAVPDFFKKKNIDTLISNFFLFLFFKKKILISDLINWIHINIFIELKDWNYINGILVLLEIEYYYPILLKHPSPKMLQKININKALSMLKI